jgi:hypothetical protein
MGRNGAEPNWSTQFSPFVQRRKKNQPLNHWIQSIPTYHSFKLHFNNVLPYIKQSLPFRFSGCIPILAICATCPAHPVLHWTIPVIFVKGASSEAPHCALPSTLLSLPFPLLSALLFSWCQRPALPPTLGRSLVTVAWRVFRLRIEQVACSCRGQLTRGSSRT